MSVFAPPRTQGGESFDVSLTIPESNSHAAYMSDQPPYANYGTEENYGDLQGLTSTLPQQEADTTSAAHNHAHHQQTMYQHQMAVGGNMVHANPQFPPQNLYIPPISQPGNMGPVQTTGYMAHPGCGPPTPVYTSASVAMHGAGPPQAPHMMSGVGGMMAYYPRPQMVRSGGSPNSGGSPSPGSDDSDDSTPLAQMGRGKRPSSESTEGPARGKKPKVSKKSKKKRDPNEPQKPVSAYALFFRDTQAAIKGSNPNASFGEVSKIVASMWDSLDADHKNVYKKKTEAAKKEYLKALAAYRASLVSKGGEGDGVYGAPGYGQFAPGFGYPPTTSAPGHPQIQSSTQMSPLAKKSPLLSSLMADPPPPMMTPPMSQPMPPSGPPMMPHGSMPPMSAASMAPQAQQGPQAAHQPPTPQSHLTPMTNVPTTSPYMNQQAPGSMTSPGGGGSPGSRPQHQPQQTPQQAATQQQQQQAGQQQQHQQQAGQHGQQQQPPQQQQQQPPQQTQQQQQQSGQGSGGQQQGQQGHVGCPTSGPNCIRSGCTNPAVHNPEWEDEYCSNECVVSHCRDVFSTWVAGNHHQPNTPTYPAPVK
ncbi:TOX high mobility group box family member 3-like isoform X2 [Penaeus chinensis]|uniref:TOX high mobility group box family member 3-like isoform X2 n=1 Tax=Penaeus chinensis TaxID=139456 RepID=UPI001FB83F5B|nr:TOX high mobility group box family member 3-like isoform X2 [Penaeus chinensis]